MICTAMSPNFRLADTPCLRFPRGKHGMPLARMESCYNRKGVKVSITPDIALPCPQILSFGICAMNIQYLCLKVFTLAVCGKLGIFGPLLGKKYYLALGLGPYYRPKFTRKKIPVKACIAGQKTKHAKVEKHRQSDLYIKIMPFYLAQGR